MQIEYISFDLELKNTFTISHGSRNFQPTLVVKITDSGYIGYGEAAATVYYGVTVEKMISSINSVEPILKENIHLSPEEIWEITFPHLKDNPFAQCALDMAIHDLHGKRNHKPLFELWGLDPKDIPLTNYTIGIDSVENMCQKMQEFAWPLYKIKLGTNEDVKIIKELRKHSDAVFRVDANAAWSVEQALENIEAFKELNVEFVEQPLHPEDIQGMEVLYKRSLLPLIADESCIIEGDVEKCKPYFHGVNIKLTKCAGVTPAKRMIYKARELGMKAMVGCMTESSIGISAIAQLAPLLDYVDMDGAMLLKNDIADGVKIYDKKVHFPDRNGTGAQLLN